MGRRAQEPTLTMSMKTRRGDRTAVRSCGRGGGGGDGGHIPGVLGG